MPLCESDLPLSQNNRCGLALHNNMAFCYLKEAPAHLYLGVLTII